LVADRKQERKILGGDLVRPLSVSGERKRRVRLHPLCQRERGKERGEIESRRHGSRKGGGGGENFIKGPLLSEVTSTLHVILHASRREEKKERGGFPYQVKKGRQRPRKKPLARSVKKGKKKEKTITLRKPRKERDVRKKVAWEPGKGGGEKKGGRKASDLFFVLVAEKKKGDAIRTGDTSPTARQREGEKKGKRIKSYLPHLCSRAKGERGRSQKISVQHERKGGGEKGS